jgi:hypothetical protein
MAEGGTDKKSKPLTKAQRAIVNAGTEIRLDRATAEDPAYLARQFVQATLPHSDPKADTWSRQNGNFTLGIQAGFNVKTGKSYGLPYEIIPRLLLSGLPPRPSRPRVRGSNWVQAWRDFCVRSD